MKKVKNIQSAVQKLKQMMQMKKDGMKGKLAAFMNLLVASGKKASVLACLVAMLACASVDKKHGMNEADSEKDLCGITEQDGKEMDEKIQKFSDEERAEQERVALDELIQELLRKQEGGHCATTAKDDAEFEKFIQGIINGKAR